MQEFLWKGLAGSVDFINGPMLVAAFLIVAAAGYLIGGLNFAIIISRVVYRDDIRKYGSGNAGMTNMLRTYGKKAAAMTLLGDAAKALIATFIGVIVLGDFLAGGYIGGLFCVIGHVYPAFYGFKGGKGIVAAAAMIAFTCPVVFVVLLIMFVGIVASTKYLSVGSIMGMLLYPILLNGYLTITEQPRDYRLVIALTLAVFIIFLHRSNLKRLFNGTENKFSLKKKAQKTDSSPQIK